jgi:cold shock CspA family protein
LQIPSNQGRGYGFIAAGDGREFFVHISEVVEDASLIIDERVSFVEGVGRDQRPLARQVTRA